MRSPTLLPPLLAVLFLICANVAVGYVQFEQLLALKDGTELEAEIRATKKATYGRPTRNTWSRIGRTTEDHNCILPGCTLMGEVLNIQSSNVTRYDKDSLKDRVEKRRRAVSFLSATRRRLASCV